MTDSGLKTNGKLIYDRWSELRDYGLARLISTPGDTRGLTHEKSEAAGASQSNPPSDGIRSSQGRSQGFVCGQESGGVAVPSCRLCPFFESLGVVSPYLRGSILSCLVSFIRQGLGRWVLCRRRCLQRRGYPQWIRPALTSNSAKKSLL